MFRWLRRLMSSDPETVNIHITGEVKVKHEGGTGYTVVSTQGLSNVDATPKAGAGLGRGPQAAEPDITPGFFADTGTPEVNFGIDAEIPPKKAPDTDH